MYSITMMSEQYNINEIDNLLWITYFNNSNINEELIYINNKDLFDSKNISSDNIKDRLNKINVYRNTLNDLKKMPLIKQRTPEWFELRKDRLTASDAYDAIQKNNLLLARKKANVYIDEVNLNKVPPIKWGTMFEEMAMRCYSQKNYNMKINEFGLIPDKELEHFGASPDGITEMGIMIEIKCPYIRKIQDGIIPPKYYMQMQGQLAVCKLEECDYVECDFKQYNKIEEYLQDLDGELKYDHGVIAEFSTKDTDEYRYIYSEEFLTPSECLDIVSKEAMKRVSEDNNLIFNKLIPWKLNLINVQRVYFNDEEWNIIKPKIINFWNKVEECKKLPVEYKRKTKKLEFIEDKD